jgi:hypothetical protein
MKRPQKTEVTKAATPDWLETPPDMDYSLDMGDQGDVLQHVILTREEFIVLKQRLATMRDREAMKRSA